MPVPAACTGSGARYQGVPTSQAWSSVSNSALPTVCKEIGPSLSCCAWGHSLEHIWGPGVPRAETHCGHRSWPLLTRAGPGALRGPSHKGTQVLKVSELKLRMVAEAGEGTDPAASAFLSLTSRAVRRKSYRPPTWMGSIMSRIRWISAPRCWILQNRPQVRGRRGYIRDRHRAAGKGALAWAARHLQCGPCSASGTHGTQAGTLGVSALWASASPVVPRKTVPINPDVQRLHCSECVLVGGRAGGKGASAWPGCSSPGT